MTQTEIEKSLIGMWQNLKTNYLWSFYPLSDGQRNGIIVDDNRPVGGRLFNYEIIATAGEDIFIDLVVVGIRTQHKVVFLADKIIEIYNPPIDNGGNVQIESIILNKVSL